MDYAVFFAGMLTMASLGGLAFLIIRPWFRPMRRDWEASHEVVAENSRLAAAQVRRQTEETCSRLIEVQAENDLLEIQRREALKQAGIDPDKPPPKSWFVKHRYLVATTIAISGTILIIVIGTIIK